MIGNARPDHSAPSRDILTEVAAICDRSAPYMLIPLINDPLNCPTVSAEDNSEQLVAQRIVYERERRNRGITLEAARFVLLP